MTQNTENTPQTPTKPPLTKKLQDRLELLLEDQPSFTPVCIMAEQSKLLDAAFRKAIHHAIGGSFYEHKFLAALKAQNQYRMTVNALELFDSPRDGKRKT